MQTDSFQADIYTSNFIKSQKPIPRCYTPYYLNKKMHHYECFAVNRLLHIIWIEANRSVEEGVATPEDIDTACKLGLGHPIGPYTLMDLTGNDLNMGVQEILHESYGERFKPRSVLKQKVYANHLGRKNGRGWFNYQI